MLYELTYYTAVNVGTGRYEKALVQIDDETTLDKLLSANPPAFIYVRQHDGGFMVVPTKNIDLIREVSGGNPQGQRTEPPDSLETKGYVAS